MLKKNMDNVVGLFDWSAVKLNELRNFAASGQLQSNVDKNCRYVCYMFEMTYVLVIESRRNISSNPGSE